jgi:hypothetical protein
MNSERTSTNTKVKQRILEKKERYEFKMTTQNIKQEVNKDMENLRQKNQTEVIEIKSPFSQTKNTVEGHCSRLEQGKTKSQSSKIK